MLRVVDMGKLPGQMFLRGWGLVMVRAAKYADEVSAVDWKSLSEHQWAAQFDSIVFFVA